jgi:hypothetical protein
MSERAAAVFMLIASVYGGVYAVFEATELIPLFVFLVLCSVWTVAILWDEVGESD